MKILMLVHSLRRGGAERVVLELAKGLKNRGHQVDVVAWLEVDEYEDAYYRDVRRHYLMPKREYRWIRSIPRSAKALRDLVGHLSPDVIAMHTPNVSWLAGWANTGVPCVHVLHGYGDITRVSGPHALFVRHIYRLVARRLGTSFVTVSDSMRSVAASFFGVDPMRMYTVPNGIDLDRFPYRDEKPCGSVNILMLGTLTENKGQRLGIAAFRLLFKRHPNAKLWIVGEGPDRTALESRIAEYGLENSVILAGMRDDVADVFARTHLLWHLSESEAMPMVVLEAMATGVPVVGFDVRGTRDAIARGETALLVTYGDIEGVVKSSIDLLANVTEYRRLASNGRQRAERIFSCQAMVEGHERVLLCTK